MPTIRPRLSHLARSVHHSIHHPPSLLLVALALLVAFGSLAFSTPSTFAASRFSFEDGSLQGWSRTGSVSTIANSTDHARVGSHSLKITLASTSFSSAGFVRVNPQGIVGSGNTLEAYVYSASNGPATASLYVQDQAYRQTFGSRVSLSVGWNHLTYTVPSTASLPLRLVGLQFGGNSPASSTVYLDEVGTIGSAIAPISTRTATSTPRATATRTSTPAPTSTPQSTSTRAATSTPRPINTATPVSTSTPRPTNTSTPAATSTPLPTRTSTPAATPAAVSARVLRGVNLAVAEFGDSKIHGTLGVDYTYPTTAELDYFHSKGLNLVRLPVRWERIQHSINGPIDSSGDIARIDAFLAAARARGMSVVIDIHNYGRYKQNVNGSLQTYVVGSSQLPVSAYANLWSQLAQHWAGNSAVYAYDIMNEPHDMNGVWPQAAQAAVDAIRRYDTGHTIVVSGDGWSTASTWRNVNENLRIRDASNKIVYQAHQYFDANNSGFYAGSYDAEHAYPNIGADRVKPFVDWLRANGYKGFIGEYGVPGNDSRWLTVLDNFLTALDNASDVGLSSTYWAAGPWWGGYSLSVEPSGGADRPQMGVLTRHLGR